MKAQYVLLKMSFPFFVVWYREDSSTPNHNSNKYIVYENCIMKLFNVCPICMWCEDPKAGDIPVCEAAVPPLHI